MKSHSDHQLILILDYGSQYTQLIARRVRDLGFYSKILPGPRPGVKTSTQNWSEITKQNPRAVVLSGGPSSAYEAGAPTLPDGFLEWQKTTGVGVLGICYGMQLLARAFGGEVSPGKVREYGRMRVLPKSGAKPFHAWMSHGDEVAAMPPQFSEWARTEEGGLAGMEFRERKLLALQFHPEVTHTEGGLEILKQFLTGVCGLSPDWTMGSVIEEQIEKIRTLVGPDDHVICGLSGGVDSAVASVLVHRALGARLHCVFVDHGLLRFEEGDRVMKLFKDQLHLPVERADASEVFLTALQGVSDPEQKRKIIGKLFIQTFDEAADRLSKRLGSQPRFLVQGTLYPDVIESSPGHTHAATIKSHHNVGGLPKDLKFTLIEPLRDLFKDEVRAMGKELGVPTDFLQRHPFPGPGLAVRILGDITPDRLKILQHVDEIFIEALKREGIYHSIWQAFAVFLPIRSVGVQGDGRTHDHVVALRAVTSSDGMTADWYPFEHKFLAAVSSEICNKVKGVGRVVYDISSKPPATIEWE